MAVASLHRLATRIPAAFAAALLVATLPAAAGEWTSLGPEGGVVWGLGVDPTDTQVVYAGSEASGIFKSLDGGESWRRLPGSFAGFDYPYEEILVGPSDPHQVYARTSYLEIFKSDDAGETWRRISAALPNEGHSANDLALDSTDPSHLLAATTEGPFESFDGGAGWQPVADFPLAPNSSPPSRADTGSVAIDPTDPDVLYATTSSLGVLRSTDGGESWSAANQGVSPTLGAQRIVIAPSAPSRLYLATLAGGLYRSSDGAASWQRLEPGLGGVITQLEVDRLDPDSLFGVVYREGLSHSGDGGRHWSRIDAGITGAIHAFAADPADPQVLHAGSDEGPWRSADGGATWRLRVTGLNAQQVRRVAAVAGAEPAVLAGTEDGGILRRRTGGGGWSRVYPAPPAPLSGDQVTALAASPGDPSRVFAALGFSFEESADGGRTWSPVPLPSLGFPIFFTRLFPDPADPSTLYAAGTETIPFSLDPAVLLKTTDGGVSWTNVVPDLGSGIDALAVDPGDSDLLFAGGSETFGFLHPSLHRSTDGGASWTDLADRFPGGAPAVVSLAYDPPRLYAALREEGLFRSLDQGDSWARIGAGLPAGSIHSLVLGTGDPAPIYAVVGGEGVFRSTDGGLSWAPVGAGLPGDVHDLALLPGTPATLFASAAEGVYRLADAGCQPTPTALCLGDGRFRAEIFWQAPRDRSGVGRAVPLTSETGAFWFFAPENLEVAVKVLDGSAVNGHYWVFFGGLTNLAFTLRVTDTASGAQQVYTNPRGTFASRGDVRAFPAAAAAVPGAIASPPAVAGKAADLHLLGGRFRVAATWIDGQGRRRGARAVALTPDGGYFTFTGPGNVELLVKVVDGRPVNGHFWFFYAALSNLGFELTVTDTESGARQVYANPRGTFASRADVRAF